jgi:hypothetical protein
MSKFVSVKTEIRELAHLRRALDDLKLDYRENVIYTHPYSRTSRTNALVIKQGAVTFAFAPQKSEASAYDLLFDDMQAKMVDALVGKIRQRYAYHKVVEETHAVGFELVEERTGADDVVRLTVRRWA